MNLETVIKRPLITEKTALETDSFNRFSFVVDLKANKNQIKNAVEALYDVKVLKVRTNVTPGKVKRAGKGLKKTSSFKKAFVELAEGQKIEFFKGV
ncbi:MAG: 50S ribosomal protein L23 [Halobacteriovorax sp.]|nr:50S ribosomal protein L23 [Halobacteriovorax sp.]